MVVHKEVKIDNKVVTEHGLTQDEYQKIIKILGRKPNIVELGMYSVLWSEHCSYKSSKPLLKLFPTKSEHVLQGPGENAGIVDIGDGLAISMKIESHNHPSAVEPYQGAATGVGGIVRDVFTMGAKPIASLNSLRFGPLDNPNNRYLFDGVVAGIAGYGNCLGLPTVAGEVGFDESYTGNCLVNAMCVGIVRTTNNKYMLPSDPLTDELGPLIVKATASGVGNPVLYVGSATGRDGIHGATFASVELSEESEEKKSSVQVGDPFTEKVLIEACMELIRSEIVVGMQDMGAAGLTSSTSEMASRANTGIEMDIAKVPQREDKMSAYEIMLSESQERMVIVVQKGKEEQAIQIFEKWGLHALVIGSVTKDGMLRVKIGKKVIAEVPAKSLADDAPVYDRKAKQPMYINQVQNKRIVPKKHKDLNEVFLKVLSSPNIANKSWVYEQYDHMVQTNTMVLPGVADASVLRIKDTGKRIALTVDGNGRYCYLNPREGGKIVVAEAARNLACTGAIPLALTNCLNFGNPEKADIFWQFKEAVTGMAEACKELEIPVISGNVSFYNENNSVAVYPTPVVGMLGLIDKGKPHVTQGFQKKNDLIILIGETKNELGGSEYLKVIENKVTGNSPLINLKQEKEVQKMVLTLIKDKIAHSAHDCADGGLVVALAECVIFAEPKAKGAQIQIDSKLNPIVLLFSESQSRVVVSISEENMFAFQVLAKSFDLPYAVIGKIGGTRLVVKQKRKTLINLLSSKLSSAYFDTIPKIMKG